MTRNSIIIILSLLLLAISFCSGIFVHRSWSRSQIHQEQPDTVWVEKEVTILTPLPDKVVSAPADIEPVAIPKEDLKPSADTTIMTVHPEVSTYRDTLPSGASYDIQITGVGTRLSCTYDLARSHYKSDIRMERMGIVSYWQRNDCRISANRYDCRDRNRTWIYLRSFFHRSRPWNCVESSSRIYRAYAPSLHDRNNQTPSS